MLSAPNRMHQFEKPELTEQYSYEDVVFSGVLEGLSVQLSEIEEIF